MNSLIYDTGTVTVETGSATVIGNLTGWAVALLDGGMFSCDGLSIPVLSVEDDTHLTLAYDWPGDDGSGKVYAISRTPSEATARAATWTVDRLARLAQTPWGIGVVPDGRGTLAQRDALNPMPTDDFCWLRVEVDEPAELYFRDAGQWLGPYEFTAGEAGPPGPLASIEIGDTTTLAPGSEATVVNSGTPTAPKLDFGIPAGAGFDNKGAYASETAYVKGDVVTYNGSSYIAKQATTGNVPTSGTYWDLLAAKGTDGTGTGDVLGPSSSNDGELVAFDGTTGKLVKKADAVPDGQMPSRVGVVATVVTNWNNALDNGWYMANSATNAPTTGWFIGIVEARGDGGSGSQYRTQTVHNFVDAAAGNTVAYRRHQKGTWGAWYKLQISQAEQDARYLQLAAQTLSDAQKAQARLNIDAIGNLHKITIYSANHLPSGTHAFAAYTKKARVRVKGAGAGSGSVTGAPSSAQATNTGGGGEGGEAIKFFELGSITSATIVVGAAGAADANGGNSSYSDGVNTLTGNGGQASAGQPAAASGFRVSAGGTGGTATGGDINVRGQAGDYGFSAGTSVVASQTSATGGKGGGTSGGAAPVLGTSATAGQSAGNNATGYGCGASGAVSVGGGTTVSGGAGSGGIVIIEEYK